MYEGSEHPDIFGKGSPEYDAFIRAKQRRGQFHTLKPEGWEEGQCCDFGLASAFLNRCGFNSLLLDMATYREQLDLDSLVEEAKREFPVNREAALRQIETNFEEAKTGVGCYGHDYGPVLAMVQMADERLFPILTRHGLRDYLTLAPPPSAPALTPVFLSNSQLARFFKDVPDEVRDSCLLMFGSEHKDIFGKADAVYDAFIRQKQRSGQFHTLKPKGWREGKRCDFNEASKFLNSCGFNSLLLDMETYEERFDLDSLFEEARRKFRGDRAAALKQVESNFRDAERGVGYYGHDYGPILAMVQMADERLFPIMSKRGLQEYVARVAGC